HSGTLIQQRRNVRRSAGRVVATNDGDGVRVIATAFLSLIITGTSVVNNFGTGVLASGAAAIVRIGGATISGNATGVSFAGATMQSFKNNQIAGNNTDGTPIPPFSGPGAACSSGLPCIAVGKMFSACRKIRVKRSDCVKTVRSTNGPTLRW